MLIRNTTCRDYCSKSVISDSAGTWWLACLLAVLACCKIEIIIENSMARQWLRKAELNEKLWKGDSFALEPSSVLVAAGSCCRPVLSAESLAKVFLLVVVNSIFLLGALQVLYSKREFGAIVDDRSGDCVRRDRLHNVQSSFLPALQEHRKNIPIKSIPVLTNASSTFENVRHFNTHGEAVHLFVKMSAHRSSENSFAIVGLEAKTPANLYNHPPYECVWLPSSDSNAPSPSKSIATKLLPDTVYSRLYSAVILNCTFAQDVGVDSKGGQLVLYASYGDHHPRISERIVALMESVDEYTSSPTTSPYDYVYCGSPLFGNLSPQKIREWLAYHAHFFGPKSHFFLYDAGGVHEEVRRVIAPWIEAGKVTLDNIREQEKFDGYYHNQFMVVNDCFHRARNLARWLFFFDVDEYLWAPADDDDLADIVARYENQSQIIIWQKPMARNLCATQGNDSGSKWTFEKLVFKSVKVRESNDCKYAIQPRKAMATGIHRSEHLIGDNATAYAHPLNYYHYHNTINKRAEVCEEYVDKNLLYVNPRNHSDLFAYDDGLAKLADRVKEFEIDVIGPQLYPTAL